MKSVCISLIPTLALAVGVFTSCGGTSGGGTGSSAGSNAGGATGAAGTAAAGASAGSSGDGMNTAGASAGTAGSANQGGGGASSAGATSAGQAGLGECAKADCGPALGLPNWVCEDGGVGGPTGRCLRNPNGTCGWEVNDCTPAGQGGASNQGGQGNVAGRSGAGGAGAGNCGGCSAGEVCVFQNGGPGPSHFVCATQNPCGAAAACSCIVGQGTCQPNLAGDPPSYCMCDNGLN
ncbi:MAG TPA: hypothetical protein VER11_29740 [Polyangiaceae bacterium]|nr:hypothetical protein [Polyangiaceae bacterium]